MTDEKRESLLGKVRALLAQAEDPGATPEEAKAFSAGAQRLMEKYSFSLLEIEAHGNKQVDEIIVRKIFVEAPYAHAKIDLWSRIARANNVKVVRSHDTRSTQHIKVDDDSERGWHWETVRNSKGKAVKGGYVWLHGFRTNVEHVEILFTSLLIQVTNELLKTECPSWENTKTFRNSFIIGYADTIGARLRKAIKETQAEEVARVKEETGETVNLLPVLADRKQRIENEALKFHGKLVSSGRSYNVGGGGYGAGREAGNRASLGGSGLKGRKALSS